MAVITGTGRDDFLTGTGSADVISGLEGADTMQGSGGSDLLLGGPDADALFGQTGADTLRGGGGDDRLEGGSGADRLEGGAGTDIAVYLRSAFGVVVDLGLGRGTGGEARGDLLVGVEGVVGSSFADQITGSDAADRIFGAHGPDTILGLGGDDLIRADSGPVFPLPHELTRETSVLDGGAGNDTIWGDTHWSGGPEPGYVQPATIFGGDGDDEIYNGFHVDAGPGNDYVYGGTVDSTIDGGDGDDEIEATYGNHTVRGGSGDDYVWTEALHGGTNVVDLGPGNDTGAVWSYDPAFAHRFNGAGGVDSFVFACDDVSLSTVVRLDLLDDPVLALGTIRIRDFEQLTLLLAGEHDDVIRLGPLTDFVRAGDGDDRIVGRGGADFLDGGYGVDTLLGGGGNDILVAGSSPAGRPETARGGDGNDVLYGNFSAADFSGVARLYGDSGKDVFAFLPGGIHTPDRVMDFDAAEDLVALYAGGYYYVDVTARAFTTLAPLSVVDDDASLRFTYVGAWGEFSEPREVEVRYDKLAGTLDLRAADEGDWIRLATLAGAPALDTTHFLTMMEVSSAGTGDATIDFGLPIPAVAGVFDSGWFGA